MTVIKQDVQLIEQAGGFYPRIYGIHRATNTQWRGTTWRCQFPLPKGMLFMHSLRHLRDRQTDGETGGHLHRGL